MKRIALHSVPRSGSTWLGNIFNSHPNVCFRYQPLFSYAFKDALSNVSSKEDIISFFKDIKSSSDGFIIQEEGVKKGIIPTFEKEEITHICYKEVRYHHIINDLLTKDNELIVFGLLRNPFATIHSWLNAPKEFKKELGWNVEEEWRWAPKKNLNKPEEYNGFEKWKEVALLFEGLKEEFPERFYLVNYDNLLKNTEKTTENLFSFAGINLSKQTLHFLKESRSRKNNVKDAYGVFNNKINDEGWKQELSEYIIREIKADQTFQKLNEKYNWV